MGRGGEEAVLADIVTEWRANRATGRFELVPTVGVVWLDDVEGDL